MSASAGLQPEPSFLARWMSCSPRAGVILDPPPALLSRAGRDGSPAAPGGDDSFSAQFLPLPVSRSSSCLSVDSLGPAGPESAAPGPAARLGSPEELDTAGQRHSAPLMRQLEQLKEWQQQKQEQLKNQQMQQLRRLLEEQQRLLHMASAQQALADDPDAPQAVEGEELWERPLTPEVQPDPPGDWEAPLDQCTPGLQVDGGPALGALGGSPCVLQRAAGATSDTEEEEDSDCSLGRSLWSDDPSGEELCRSSGYEDEPQCSHPAARDEFAPGPAGAASPREGRPLPSDRPIKPGIGGRKQTFEELLEEQMRLEEQRLGENREQGRAAAEVKAQPKRAFLKRGEGLSRFTKGKAAPVKETSKTDAKPQPKTSCQRTVAPRSSQQPVQRKTAILSKESSSERLTGPPNRSQVVSLAKGSKAQNVLGSAAGHSAAVESKQLSVSGQAQEALAVKVQGKKAGGSMPACAGPGKTAPAKQGCSEETKQCVPPKTSMHIPPPEQEYSFELSFQRKLESWEKEKQKENLELDEFELLEQAADEISFSSNSSFVQRVLHLDRLDCRRRRLSSTPIKPPKAVKTGPERSAHDRAARSPPETGDTRTEQARSESVLKDLDKGPGDGNGECDEDSDSSWQSGSASEDMDDTLTGGRAPRVGRARAGGHGCDARVRYDKTSYEDGAVRRGDGGEAGCTGSASPTAPAAPGPAAEDAFVFDDDDTWNDLEEDVNGNDAAGRLSAADKGLKRKVAAVKAAGSKPGGSPADSGPPLASDLMTRLFPALKPKPKPAPSREDDPVSTAPGHNPQSALLRERLVELETQIERFRAENSALASLRQEREAALEKLRKEVAEFEQKKAEELARLEELKKEEMKKLQKERKVFEKYAAAARAIPDKKEREEMQALRQQAAALQEELRRREARWAGAQRRLRLQLDALGRENAALREEVGVLGRLRVQAWRKAEAGAEGTAAGGRRPQPTVSPGSARAPYCLRSLSVFVDAAESNATCISSVKSLQVTATNSPPPTKTARENSTVAEGTVNSIRSVPVPTAVSSIEEQVMSELRKTELHPESPVVLPASTVPTDEPQKDLCGVEENGEILEETIHPDGKIEKVLKSGIRVIVFPNGTQKEVMADGKSVKVTFFNGDVKQILADQRVVYYYADAQTTHTTYPDGLEVLQFPNNQIEKHFPDGRKEITFPDQTIKNLYPDGQEESVFPDGTIIQVKLDGSKVIEFNNGQREVHTAEYKRREYPDGTVKTVYANGQQETKYPTGRVRIKDKDGNIVMDTKVDSEQALLSPHSQSILYS
ncbi:centromere protein J [Lepisosteus oculatus]|uniref:centromere protein J n=1 Tax=Lepisosteus oculatus TaxID=7918 RepID=UPI0035F51990